MLQVAAYMRTMRPDVPRVVLCGTPADLGEEMCRSLKWKAAIGVGYFPARNDAHIDGMRNSCDRVDEFIEWRTPPAPAPAPAANSSSGGNSTQPPLPELWTRWEYFDMPDDKLKGAEGLQPRKTGPPQRIPVVHWQGGCKPNGVRYVQEQYTSRGLLPTL